LHGNVNTEILIADKAKKPDNAYKIDELFSPEEKDVAFLIMEGKMRSEITRSLHLTAAEADSRIHAIREKLNLMGDPDPLIAATITEYRLTRRETDMLRCLLRENSYAEIAAELFISEETIRIHVRSLLRKLKIDNRIDILAWAKLFAKSKNIAL
jgi:DNA-binding NarL/FixJ family response regulator